MAKSEIRQIRKLCAKDCFLWATQFVKTRDPQADDPVRLFPEYDFLRGFFKTVAENPIVAAPKSRQMLASWACVVKALHNCSWFDYRLWFLQSEKEDKAKDLIGRAAFILEWIERLYPWLMPCTWKIKTDRIQFSNGSLLQAVPQGGNQIAGYTPSGVVMDEAGLQEEAESSWFTMLPALRHGGQTIWASTPRGHNFFFKLCHEIKSVVIYRIHYRMHPVYQAEALRMGGWEQWIQYMKEHWGYDDKTWRREMEIDFDIAGGAPVFKPPFDSKVHVQKLVPHPALPVDRGWDFGFHQPAVVWHQMAVNGQSLFLREFRGKDMLLSEFVKGVQAISREMKPHYIEGARGALQSFVDYCDPSGYNKNDMGLSQVQMLNAHRIYPQSPKKKVPVKESLELMRENLKVVRIGGALRPGTLVDPSCKILIRAFNGAVSKAEKDIEKYIFGGTKDVVDAARYIVSAKYNLGATDARRKDRQQRPSWQRS